MEFICEKKELQNCVSAVDRIVATRSTLPIIGNILIEADKSSVSFSANNLETGIQLKIKAKVIKSGAILVPAKTLAGIVGKLPETQIGFKLNEKGIMKISYGSSSFNMHTLPPDEFPNLPKIKESKSITLNADVFTSMIKKTIFAVSNSEDKYILNGVLIEIGKGADSSNIRLVTTDGYRLAKRGEKIKLDKEEKISVIVPAKAMQEVLRIIEQKEEEELKIIVSNEQIAFSCDDIYLISRIIQGQFPDYKQVIPKKPGVKVTLSTKALLEACERAAVIASGSANLVRLELRGGKLHLSAQTPDVGTIDELIDAEGKASEKLMVAFNIRLVIDVLKVIESEKTIFEFSEALGPGVIREDENKDFIYIVMPIRTQENN